MLLRTRLHQGTQKKLPRPRTRPRVRPPEHLPLRTLKQLHLLALKPWLLTYLLFSQSGSQTRKPQPQQLEPTQRH